MRAKCSHPKCPYLIHSSRASEFVSDNGLHCCQKCSWSSLKRPPKHGDKCELHEAPNNEETTTATTARSQDSQVAPAGVATAAHGFTGPGHTAFLPPMQYTGNGLVSRSVAPQQRCPRDRSSSSESSHLAHAVPPPCKPPLPVPGGRSRSPPRAAVQAAPHGVSVVPQQPLEAMMRAKCSHPKCPYLIHSSRASEFVSDNGLHCCQKCSWSSLKRPPKHGDKCELHEAPNNEETTTATTARSQDSQVAPAGVATAARGLLVGI